MVFSKLYKQTSVDLDRRHFRALKAMFVIMPVLGFTYVLTIVGPSHSESPTGHKVFQAIRATLLSTQGFVVTLPYCYLNTEVRNNTVIYCELFFPNVISLFSMNLKAGVTYSIC